MFETRAMTQRRPKSSTQIQMMLSRALVRTSRRCPHRSLSTALKDSYEFIIAEKKDAVGLITLNRPSALNALSEGLFADLVHASKAFDKDDEVGCMVLTGSSKAFAAGADIKEMSEITFVEAFSKVRLYLS